MNNHYGMGGQPCGETMGCRFIARIGAGVNPDQMHAERVNGYDPLAVIDAFRRKKRVLLEGKGPALLDTIARLCEGHLAYERVGLGARVARLPALVPGDLGVAPIGSQRDRVLGPEPP